MENVLGKVLVLKGFPKNGKYPHLLPAPKLVLGDRGAGGGGGAGLPREAKPLQLSCELVKAPPAPAANPLNPFREGLSPFSVIWESIDAKVNLL